MRQRGWACLLNSRLQKHRTAPRVVLADPRGGLPVLRKFVRLLIRKCPEIVRKMTCATYAGFIDKTLACMLGAALQASEEPEASKF